MFADSYFRQFTPYGFASFLELLVKLGWCFHATVFSNPRFCRWTYENLWYHMVVSWNRGTPKSSIFNKIFHYKPSILGFHGVPPFMETPICWYIFLGMIATSYILWSVGQKKLTRRRFSDARGGDSMGVGKRSILQALSGRSTKSLLSNKFVKRILLNEYVHFSCNIRCV